MKKKLLSLFMACAMILALAVPAFAEPYFEHSEGAVSADLSQEVTITTRTFIPTVKLTLPSLTEPSIVLNPYKITFAGEDDLLLNGYAVANTDEQVKQVISPVYTIKNQTNVKLNYTVAVTGTVEGGVTFSNDAVSLTEKAKKAHVALMVSNRGAGAAAIDNAASTQNANTAQNIVGFGARAASGTVTAVDALTKDDIETIWLKTTEVKSGVPKSLEPGNVNPNYVAFQFKGDLTRLATPNAWTAEDKIGAVLTFTFTPESKQDFYYPATGEFDIGVVTCDNGAFTAKEIDATNITTLATFKVNSDVTKANWAVFKADSKEIIQVAKNTGGTAWEIKVDPNKTKLITTQPDGTALSTNASTGYYTDKVVLSFVDEDSIPRTVEIAIKYQVKKSA